MEPGGSTGDEFYTHDGEEAGLVLEGEMKLTVDAEELDAQDRRQLPLRQPPPAPLQQSVRQGQGGGAVGELRFGRKLTRGAVAGDKFA